MISVQTEDALDILSGEFKAKYIDVVQRMAAGDAVESSEVREAISSLGASLATLRRDVDTLRDRKRAASELANSQDAAKLVTAKESEATGLAKEIEARRRAFEAREIRPLLDGLEALRREVKQLQEAAHTGESIRTLRQSADPAIAGRIAAEHQKLNETWRHMAELRDEIRALEERVALAVAIREQFDEFKETGCFYQRRDRKGRPVADYWLAGLPLTPPGQVPDSLLVRKCEDRVQAFENAADALVAARQRLNVELPAAVHKCEVEIERVTASQLEPMAMALAENKNRTVARACKSATKLSASQSKCSCR